MRIDLNNAIAQQIAAERADKSNNKPASTSSTSEDKASFSHGAETLSSLVQKALAPSTDRATKVVALRDSVAKGQYKTDPDATAEAMIKEGSE